MFVLCILIFLRHLIGYGLIYKLKHCGVSGQLLFLIQNFLKNRKQRNVLNGQSSKWGDISAGVPQSSILGPLLFLVYINDLAIGLKCNVNLFADDTSLFTVVEDSNTAANAVAAWQRLRAREKLVEKGPMMASSPFLKKKNPAPLSQFMLPR